MLIVDIVLNIRASNSIVGSFLLNVHYIRLVIRGMN